MNIGSGVSNVYFQRIMLRNSNLTNGCQFVLINTLLASESGLTNFTLVNSTFENIIEVKDLLAVEQSLDTALIFNLYGRIDATLEDIIIESMSLQGNLCFLYYL